MAEFESLELHDGLIVSAYMNYAKRDLAIVVELYASNDERGNANQDSD